MMLIGLLSGRNGAPVGAEMAHHGQSAWSRIMAAQARLAWN